MGSSFKDNPYSDMIKNCSHKTVQYIPISQGYGCPDCGAYVSASDMADYPHQLTSTTALFGSIVSSTPIKAESIDAESWLKPKFTKPWKANPWNKIKKKASNKAKKKAVKKLTANSPHPASVSVTYSEAPILSTDEWQSMVEGVNAAFAGDKVKATKDE